MNRRSNSPAAKRYFRRFTPAMTVYVLSIIGVTLAFNLLNPTGLIAWALSVLPAFPILAVMAAMGLYLKEEEDEFVRNVLVEAMLWGMGLTLAITTFWGFAEIYVHAPKLPSFLAFPIFCGAMGFAQPLVRRRYQ